MREQPSDTDVARCFNTTFAISEHVVLVGGAAAPYYMPSPAPHRAVIRYRENFAASALHEVAHWCIAGARRRQRPDFGYWYEPPPRDARALAAFLAVEAPVQALESLLARAAGLPFRVSLDDLDAEVSGIREQFNAAVAAQATVWEARGLPPRAARFIDALRKGDWQ